MKHSKKFILKNICVYITIITIPTHINVAANECNGEMVHALQNI